MSGQVSTEWCSLKHCLHLGTGFALLKKLIANGLVFDGPTEAQGCCCLQPIQLVICDLGMTIELSGTVNDSPEVYEHVEGACWEFRRKNRTH